MGSSLAQRNQLNEAKEILESAIKQAKSICDGEPTIDLAEVLNTLGTVLRDAEQWKESLPYFLQAKETLDDMLGPGHTHLRTSDVLQNMGTVYFELNDLSKAFQCLKDALEMKSAILGKHDNNDTMVANCFNLAYTAEMMKNFSEAKQYYKKAYNTERRIPSNTNSVRNTVAILNRLSAVCKALGQDDEALHHLNEAREMEKIAGMNWEAMNVLLHFGNKYQRGRFDRDVWSAQTSEKATDVPNSDSCWPSDQEIQELIELFSLV